MVRNCTVAKERARAESLKEERKGEASLSSAFYPHLHISLKMYLKLY